MLGMVIEVKPEQPEKAYAPIVVMLAGIVIEVKLEQFLKTLSGRVLNLVPMVIEVKPVKPSKAPGKIY